MHFKYMVHGNYDKLYWLVNRWSGKKTIIINLTSKLLKALIYSALISWHKKHAEWMQERKQFGVCENGLISRNHKGQSVIILTNCCLRWQWTTSWTLIRKKEFEFVCDSLWTFIEQGMPQCSHMIPNNNSVEFKKIPQNAKDSELDKRFHNLA